MNEQEIIRKVNAAAIFWSARRSGSDLVIQNAGEWTLEEMDQVSELLGTSRINVEHEGGGCESCGYGDELRVLGVFDE